MKFNAQKFGNYHFNTTEEFLEQHNQFMIDAMSAGIALDCYDYALSTSEYMRSIDKNQICFFLQNFTNEVSEDMFSVFVSSYLGFGFPCISNRINATKTIQKYFNNSITGCTHEIEKFCKDVYGFVGYSLYDTNEYACLTYLRNKLLFEGDFRAIIPKAVLTALCSLPILGDGCRKYHINLQRVQMLNEMGLTFDRMAVESEYKRPVKKENIASSVEIKEYAVESGVYRQQIAAEYPRPIGNKIYAPSVNREEMTQKDCRKMMEAFYKAY